MKIKRKEDKKNEEIKIMKRNKKNAIKKEERKEGC